MNLQFALNILALFSAIGVLAAGLGFAYAQFTSGSAKVKDDLINTLKETAEAERKKAERLVSEKAASETLYQQQINGLTEKVGKLQGLYEANEKEKAKYLEILQGRNPEQQKFMEMMIAAVTNGQQMQAAAQKYMTDSIEIMGEIREFMRQLNDRARKTEDFQKSVVSATEHETGNVLRKEV